VWRDLERISIQFMCDGKPAEPSKFHSTFKKRQETHHQEMSFEEEFVSLLQKQGIEFDEQYLWK
jgi:hypothetical protein